MNRLSLSRLNEAIEALSPNIEITNCVAVFRRAPNDIIEVLIGKRKSSPRAGWWALPGGHAHTNELPDKAAIRELAEETGINVGCVTPVSEDTPPGKAGREYVYAAMVNYNTPCHAGSDISELRWVPVHCIPPLAFDHDRIIIDKILPSIMDELQWME